ncbi:hypothetical protein Pmani_036618 [Petrolisthes manimaculis]|uniref:Uncharacterized protein n=1 Tax=Petrolisthes manimaculis TaxID=1843537 RepID=A0AAE1NJ11_9EUCA|nr:hypothetical protein Pmani_036618 [Petrolisthes manimaculis]
MNPSAFYGKTYDVGMPEESEDENLDSEDNDYDPEKDLEISVEESEDDGDESEHEVFPSTSGKSIATKRGRPSVDVEELYKEKARSGPTVKIPAKPIRTDKYDNFPDFGEKNARCKNPG